MAINLRKVRLRYGITIKALSIESGINPSTIYRIENRFVIPRYDTILFLDKALRSLIKNEKN